MTTVIPQRGVGQAALITGCSRGIGRAVAKRMAAEGYHVLANDLEQQRAALETLRDDIAAAGGRCDIIAGDVSTPESVARIVAEADEVVGKIDVLINNAGVLSEYAVEDLEPGEWDRMFQVNAKGTFLMAKALLGQFKEAGRGRIVNIASIGGKRGGPREAHYCASKAAIISFTQTLAREVGLHGITVNAVCPGVIDTEMGRHNFKDEDALLWIKDITAMGRVGQPEDVVGAVSFFASDDAGFITGQALNVCGGIVFH
jgi:NAD(P)-dependent dehydrogenase (short-subunit alcohol dehydrogenase family)